MQQALIVDDSKTARIALSKMLDKLKIPAAMVESGEEAIEYLKDHHPDVIFMDHMMPGMDGFAAVKAIKSNPRKASIPIVMHTTKQGDMYVGQAKALGAIDILSKPARDKDLNEILDRINSAINATIPEIEQIDIDVDDEVEDEFVPSASGTYVMPELQDLPAAASRPFLGTPRQWLFTVVWLVPTFWLLSLYLPAEENLQQLKRQQAQYINTLAWALNRQESFDYGELPFAGERLALLQELVSRLQAADFKGTIVLEGHVGDFCLVNVPLEDGTEITMLPRSDLPITACNMIGSSQQAAMQNSIAQSENFSRYITNAGLNDELAGIRLEIIPMGSRAPKFAYPVELDDLTSGDWNAIALSNNRVRIALEPDNR